MDIDQFLSQPNTAHHTKPSGTEDQVMLKTLGFHWETTMTKSFTEQIVILQTVVSLQVELKSISEIPQEDLMLTASVQLQSSSRRSVNGFQEMSL
jgi:hypothetical protein